jgi:hypothetical protein
VRAVRARELFDRCKTLPGNRCKRTPLVFEGYCFKEGFTCFVN